MHTFYETGVSIIDDFFSAANLVAGGTTLRDLIEILVAVFLITALILTRRILI